MWDIQMPIIHYVQQHSVPVAGKASTKIIEAFPQYEMIS